MAFKKGDAVFAYDDAGTPHAGTIAEYEPQRQIYKVRHDNDIPGTPLHEYPEKKVIKRVRLT
jgi:hypothetical protein